MTGALGRLDASGGFHCAACIEGHRCCHMPRASDVPVESMADLRSASARCADCGRYADDPPPAKTPPRSEDDGSGGLFGGGG